MVSFSMIYYYIISGCKLLSSHCASISLLHCLGHLKDQDAVIFLELCASKPVADVAEGISVQNIMPNN